MPNNELEIDVDVEGATRKLAGLKAELAQLIAQAKELKSVLADTQGAQRQLAAGALSGIVGRIGSIQSQLGGTVGGGVTTEHSSPDIGNLGRNVTAGAFGVSPVSGGLGQGTFAATMRFPTGSQPGLNGFAPTMQFAPGTQPGLPFGGGPVPPGYSFDGTKDPTVQTLHFTKSLGATQPMPGGFGGMRQGGGGGVPANPFPFGEFGSQDGGGGYVNQEHRYGYYAAGAALYMGADAAGRQMTYDTNRFLRGGYSPMDRASLQAGQMSDVAGLAAGAVAFAAGGGPLGAVIVGGAVKAGTNAFLEPFMKQQAAPEEQRQGYNSALAPFFAARFGPGAVHEGGMMYGYTNRPLEGVATGEFGQREAVRGDSKLARFTKRIDANLPDYMKFGGSQEIANTFADVATGLFNYGIDPFGPGERTSYREQLNPGMARYYHDRAAGIGSGKIPSKFPLMDTLINGGLSDIYGSRRLTVNETEPLALTYTRRLGTMFGIGHTDEAWKKIEPAFDPALGGNVADILGKLGATDTATYLRVTNPDGSMNSTVDPAVLSRVAGQTRMNTRSLAFAGLRPTQSGAAKEFTHIAQMAVLDQLPGGRDSLAYAQEDAGRRQGRGEHFEQDTLSGFGMRDLQLQGQQRRHEYMPFAPGNIFATSLGIIANNRGQIGRLEGMLSNKDLSESERYGYESQRQGLLTENARNVGLLSEGFENRLPALAAGRPGFFGRYNSVQGAAINLGRIGSPIRAYGAGSGAQASAQAAFVTGLGGDSVPGASMPYSRTGELNVTNDILNKILAAITAANGGGGRVGGNRPVDGRNGTAASQSGKTMPDPNYHPN